MWSHLPYRGEILCEEGDKPVRFKNVKMKPAKPMKPKKVNIICSRGAEKANRLIGEGETVKCGDCGRRCTFKAGIAFLRMRMTVKKPTTDNQGMGILAERERGGKRRGREGVPLS